MRAGLLSAAMMLSLVGSARAMPDAGVIRQADDLERRWAQQYLMEGDTKEVARLDEAVAAILPRVDAEGRFTDLTYAPQITGANGGPGWGDHLLRTVDLFTAWRTPGTKHYRDARVAEAGRRAIEHYLAAPFDRKDVWGFGHPYADLLENNRIGRICLFARSDPQTFAQADVQRWADHITARAIHRIFEPSNDPARQFTQHRPGWEGGANVLWAARGELVPYLINDDQALRVRAIDRYMHHIWSSQTDRSAKGPLGQIERLTVDGMLGEHAAPAMGSYGEWYINAVVEYRDLIQGVERWQMPAELNAHWIDILIDSVAYCYQGAIDPNLGNPLYWLNPRRNGNAKLKEWLRAFSSSSDHRSAEVQAMLAWEPGVTPWPVESKSIRHYHTTDFMTKKFPRFTASVRAISERTFGMETFSRRDDEHPWAVESVMMPLGTVLLRRDTREYQDHATGGVFTAMDFARWPGQTTRHLSREQLRSIWNRDNNGHAVRMVFGGTPFSGGVTDAHSGVMSWWQSRYVNVDRDRPGEHKASDLSVNGRRTTFFTRDAVVHLGAGFDLRHPESTFTNVEQRASGTDITTFAVAGERRSVSRGDVVSDDAIEWVWHENVAYFPPTHGRKVVQDIQQPGTPAKQIFSIWSDHGNTDRDLAFDWAVVPDVELDAVPALAASKPWHVLSNTVAQQAIQVPRDNWLGVSFHVAGSIRWRDHRIDVNRPCVMIASTDGARMTVRVADPLGTDDQIVVRVDDVAQKAGFPGYPWRGDAVQLVFDLSR
jgi:hypothetical protein